MSTAPTSTGRVLGSRLGGALSLDTGERTPLAEQNLTGWVCPDGHEFIIPLSVEAVRPDWWDCAVCGVPATDPDASTMPDLPRVDVRGRPIRPVKTHMDQLRERRTPAELEALLAEALKDLRARVARGESPTRGTNTFKR